MNKRTLLSILAIGMLLTTPLSFAAGNADHEIATATAHAQMAAAAGDMATVTMHMHHVINCLVGTSDKRFDAKAGDPCKGMGNGAVNDLGRAPAAHIRLQRALMLSERVLHDDNLDSAHHGAKLVAEVLKAADQK